MNFAFLDSGSGGVPYMARLKEMRPSATCVYVADTARFPYGEKSEEETAECAAEAARVIESRWSPDVLVVACNTISVSALGALREKFPGKNIVGTVPAIKLAASLTRTGRIGLLATRATASHPYNKRLAEKFAKGCQVFPRADGDLVSFVERKIFTASEKEKEDAARGAVEFFARMKCDVIILGCTHFTHLAAVIQNLAGPSVKVVDSRDGVARQALRTLDSMEPSARAATESDKEDDMSLYATGFESDDDEREYEALCERMGIKWRGTVA